MKLSVAKTFSIELVTLCCVSLILSCELAAAKPGYDAVSQGQGQGKGHGGSIAPGQISKQVENSAKENGKIDKLSEKQDKKEAEKQAPEEAGKLAKQDQTDADKRLKVEAEQAKPDKKGKSNSGSAQKIQVDVYGQTVPTLDSSQCLDAIGQCGMLQKLESELKPAWERTTLKKEVNKIYEQRKKELKKLKKYITVLIDFAISNPNAELSLQSELCAQQVPGSDGNSKSSTPDPWTGMGSGSGSSTPKNPVPGGNPGSGGNPKFSTPDPWAGPGENPGNNANPGTNGKPGTGGNAKTTSGSGSTGGFPSTLNPWIDPWVQTTKPAAGGKRSNECILSPWSEWSAPYGFGQQERFRSIVQPGEACLEPWERREVRNITTNDHGDYVMDEVEVVRSNFDEVFVRPLGRQPRDIVLILDSSGSISDDEFLAMKDGVKLLIDSICGGFGTNANEHRLAIVQFSTHTRTVHSFNNDQSPAALKAAVDSARPLYGITCTGEALEAAADQFNETKGSRTYAAHDVLIVTDGQSNCQEDIYGLATKLQTRTQVFALAVGLAGNPTAEAEVTSLVSDRNAHHLFSLASFFRFRDMVESVRARRDAKGCQEIVASAPRK